MLDPSQIALSTLAGFFGVAAIWIGVAQSRGRLRGRRIWVTYAVEALALALILVPAFLGRPYFALSLVLIGLAGCREMCRALSLSGERPYATLASVSIVVLLAVTEWRGLAASQTAFGLLATIILTRAIWTDSDRARASPAGSTLLAVFYPGVLLASLLSLGLGPSGFGDVFFCYVMVEINDSFAYLVGATFGRHRPFTELSPNKTIEGCLGGFAVTVAVSPVLRFAVPDLSLVEVVVAASLLSVFGLAGDLFASRVKRRAAIKDFGSLVPTHGGVLDVYDSLIFVSPMFHAYLSYCRAK